MPFSFPDIYHRKFMARVVKFAARFAERGPLSLHSPFGVIWRFFGELGEISTACIKDYPMKITLRFATGCLALAGFAFAASYAGTARAADTTVIHEGMDASTNAGTNSNSNNMLAPKSDRSSGASTGTDRHSSRHSRHYKGINRGSTSDTNANAGMGANANAPSAGSTTTINGSAGRHY
jgi:hypothetical protein